MDEVDDGRRDGGLSRRDFGLGLGAAAAALWLSRRNARAEDDPHFFRIGTAATTGTYFQIGAVLANAISKPPGTRDCDRGGGCGVPGLIAVAQATQGSVENVLAVGTGQLESALAQSDVAYWAFIGAGSAARRCGNAKDEAARRNGLALLRSHGPLRNLRAIAALYPEDVHILARKEGPIRSLGELRGKRLALGEPESGTLADARLVLEAAGLTECEVKADFSRLAQAVSDLEQGQTDAVFMVAGYPVPAIADLAAALPSRLIPIPAAVAERLTRKFSFLSPDVIPGGTYAGMDQETPTVSTMAIWVVGAQIADDLVYAITKALWSGATKRLLETAHPVAKRISLDRAIAGIAIPLHPGATRFYREAGLNPPDTQ